MKRAAIIAILILAGCGALADQLVRDAQEAVKRRLRDPESTQFRDVARCSADTNVIRGEFNSKNAYGGYVGFEPFFYADYQVAMLSDSESFESLMRRCYPNPPADSLNGIGENGLK